MKGYETHERKIYNFHEINARSIVYNLQIQYKNKTSLIVDRPIREDIAPFLKIIEKVVMILLPGLHEYCLKGKKYRV